MKINYAGYNFTHRCKHILRRPNGADSDILIITKKPSLFCIDSVEINAPENSVVIIKSHTPYTHEAIDKYYRDDWIHFELTDKEKKKYKLPYNTVIPLGDITTLSFYAEKIFHEVYNPSQSSERKTELFFELLYLEFTDKISMTDDEKKYKKSLFDLRAFIYHYPESRLSSRHYARRVDMSVSHLQHLYKDTFGISLLEDAIFARMERAKYLLKNTHYQVKEIAETLGYKSEIQFMRQFKKHNGITALQYRKKHM